MLAILINLHDYLTLNRLNIRVSGIIAVAYYIFV